MGHTSTCLTYGRDPSPCYNVAITRIVFDPFVMIVQRRPVLRSAIDLAWNAG